MPYVLARLRGVKLELIKKVLQEDAANHAEQGLYLEHVWQNADDPNEVIFISRAENLDRARAYIEKNHKRALEQDPKANLPTITFLE